jgi:hypothetical protein
MCESLRESVLLVVCVDVCLGVHVDVCLGVHVCHRPRQI